jgi:hypothetical protein
VGTFEYKSEALVSHTSGLYMGQTESIAVFSATLTQHLSLNIV